MYMSLYFYTYTHKRAIDTVTDTLKFSAVASEPRLNPLLNEELTHLIFF